MWDFDEYLQLRKETFYLLENTDIEDKTQLQEVSHKLSLIAQNERSPQILSYLNFLISRAQDLNDIETQMQLMIDKLHQVWFMYTEQETTYNILTTLLDYYKPRSQVIYHALSMQKVVIDYFYKKISFNELGKKIHSQYKKLHSACKKVSHEREKYHCMYGKLLHTLHYFKSFDKKEREKALSELSDCYHYFLNQPFRMRVVSTIIKQMLIYYRYSNDYDRFKDVYTKLEKQGILDNLLPNYKSLVLYTIGDVELHFSNVSIAESYFKRAYELFPKPPHSDITDVSFYCSLLYSYARINIALGRFNEGYQILLQLNEYMNNNPNNEQIRYFRSQKALEKTMSALFFYIMQEMNVDMFKMQGTVLEDMVNRFLEMVSDCLNTTLDKKETDSSSPEIESLFFSFTSLTLLYNTLRQVERRVKIRNEKKMLFVLEQLKKHILSTPWGKDLFRNEEFLIDIYEAKILLFNERFEDFQKHVKKKILGRENKTMPILNIWKQAFEVVSKYLEDDNIETFSASMKKLQYYCLKNGFRRTEEELRFVLQFFAAKRFYEEHEEEIKRQARIDAYIALSEKMGRELIETLSRPQSRKDNSSKE